MKPGEQVRDYVFEQRIGFGGAGEVWRARHVRLNKPVAIKVILPHLVEDENIYSRFVQEAMATANLEHPHIISVHDFFSANEDAFLVMAYIEEGSLQDRIKQHGRLSISDTLQVSHGILDALDYAHRKGVIHRDVKPSNILLGPGLHAHLVDFGIALVLGKTRVTKFGAAIGTPDYMSPEQIRGATLDHRTDVYSFGCVLYEMLSGHSPFRHSDDDTDFSLMERHMNETPEPLNLESKAMEAIVMRALEKDQEKRFAGCADMAKAIQGAGADSAATSPGLGHSRAVAPQTFKVAAAALGLTTLVSLGGWIATIGGSSVAPSTIELKTLESNLRSANATIKKLENELREAKEKAEREALGSGNATIASLRTELQDVTAALENAVRELNELKKRAPVLKERPFGQSK